MKDRLLAWWGQHHARTAEVDGVQIYVPAGVLNPILFRTGAWFARVVAERVEPGTRLLDLGCGSGVVGVLAQRAGAQVVAADVDLQACAAARANGIETVYDGDLFDALPSDEAPYDLVCFNPPYLPNPNNRHPWA
ncbi:MAG: methyltransferase, partial [Myxococcota bacterium]|nr:methyltransferase [Myxococcota bacterium]